ncbi:MAG: hypothetical protein ACR2LK_01245 [Solirubrobacteraceae bacterium]
MNPKKLLPCLAILVLSALVAAPVASAKTSVRVGIGDQSPRMFESEAYQDLNLKRTRYFVPADVMQDREERGKARAFVKAARKNKVSTLLHISTDDLRRKRGDLVSKRAYHRNVNRIVRYFRKLGVRDFGAWNEVNHDSQETWNRVSHAVSYFKSMYRAVRKRCKSCKVVGLDVLDQRGVERYIAAFYRRLSSTWRKRLRVVGIHNYSDVNRNRTRGTRRIIREVRSHNKRARFWFTETGALASLRTNFSYSESRQAKRMRNVFRYAKRFRRAGVRRVYTYNWFGSESAAVDCGETCLFDAGLVNPDGTTRDAYTVFKRSARSFKR